MNPVSLPGRPGVDRTLRTFLAAALLWAGICVTGCGRVDRVNETYGKRSGGLTSASINGTDLLAVLFESRGCRVGTWSRLSRKLETADVIVWFPDDHQLPGSEHIAYLDDWLSGRDGRTLVYVGRGYEAGLDYWKAATVQSQGAQAVQAARHLARKHLDQLRSAPLKDGQNAWLHRRWLFPHRQAQQLGGPWAEGIPADAAQIRYATELVSPGMAAAIEAQRNLAEVDAAQSGSPDVVDQIWSLYRSDDVDTWLTVDGRPFVWSRTASYWGRNNRLIVATNGAFLLNFPLASQSHRKLAEQLVDACGTDQNVIFLESGPGGPAIVETQELPLSEIHALSIWPIGPILFQWLLVGILACLALFPIFGRARTPPQKSPADFGDHVHALGELLARTADPQFARERISEYRHKYHDQENTEAERGNPFR